MNLSETEALVAAFVAAAVNPTTRQVATACGLSLDKARKVLTAIEASGYEHDGAHLAHNDIGQGGSKRGMMSRKCPPAEYVWFYT